MHMANNPNNDIFTKQFHITNSLC